MATTFKFRLYLLAFFLLVGFAALASRLFTIQIQEHHQYASLIPGERYESIRVPGIRGEIKDRNGLTMVDSTPNYELRFNLLEIVDAYKDEYGEVPWHTYKTPFRGQIRIREEIDIVEVVEKMVFPGLQELELLSDYSSNALQVHYRTHGGLVNFTYRRDIKFHEFSRFAERNLSLIHI